MFTSSELRTVVTKTLVKPLEKALTAPPSRDPESMITRIPIDMAMAGLPVFLQRTEGGWRVSLKIEIESCDEVEVQGSSNQLGKALFQISTAALDELDYIESRARRPRPVEITPMVETAAQLVDDRFEISQQIQHVTFKPVEGSFWWNPEIVESLLPLVEGKAVLVIAANRLSLRRCATLGDAKLHQLLEAAIEAQRPTHNDDLVTWRFNDDNKWHRLGRYKKRVLKHS